MLSWKSLISVLFLSLSFLLLVLAAGHILAGGGPPTSPTVAPIVTIESIRELSELTTLSVEVADVQETSIRGRVGGIHAVLLIKGDLRLGTDLSKARFESIDRGTKTAVIVLDSPTVNSARLDHNRTRIFAIGEQGLWAITPGDRMYGEVVNKAMADAQRAVAAMGSRPELQSRARRHAEELLVGFCRALGWRVEVHWSTSTSPVPARVRVEIERNFFLAISTMAL